MSEDRGSSAASVILAFLFGGAVGACVGLLLAPEAGRRTRERLRDLASEARERTLDVAEDVRDRVEEAIDQGRNLLEEKRSVLGAAYQAGRDAFSREKDRLTTSQP
jgi:gas vesicle protein